jgi:hypothetical protein
MEQMHNMFENIDNSRLSRSNIDNQDITQS